MKQYAAAVLAVIVGYFVYESESQLSVLFGNPIKADNCDTWGKWGPCLWIKSGKPQKIKGIQNRWDRPYFNQLRRGKGGCRNHLFYRIVRKRWGDAFTNVFDYLKEITTESQPCGMCSFQQSCGYGCHRRRTRGKPLNTLFVAERLCRPEQLNGHRQDIACSTAHVIDNCDLWPNHDIKLPNVTDAMRSLIFSFDFVTCTKQKRPSGRSICRCCCHPYEPDPITFKCIPKDRHVIGDHLKIE